MGQCFPALHLLQLSEGGLSTTFCSFPYFRRGIHLFCNGRDLAIVIHGTLNHSCYSSDSCETMIAAHSIHWACIRSAQSFMHRWLVPILEWPSTKKV